ncbi:MAG: translation initiation factor IF-2 N-terminal domain-containing protein, partial [Agathobacter sp.]|nr:translation initiation factor IF-2 N-terminal domain-containing protein [Agathobacter sp.]
MAKMRVHELAKELEIKSQDIIDTLSSTEYAVKSAQSGIEDAAQEIVRKKFSKKVEQPKEENAEKTDAVKPKKKNITAVFNAQYSKQARRPGANNSSARGNAKSGNGNNNDKNKSRREHTPSRPEQHSIIRPRPIGERAMRPISERTAGNNDDFSTEVVNKNNKPQNDKAQKSERQQRNAKPQGERNNNNNNNNNNRNERSDKNNDRFNKNNKPQGDRQQNDFKKRDNKPRFERETSIPVADDVRPKESRERNNNDRRNNKKQQDHDKLGKKQENYVNLEKHGGKKKPQQQPQQPKEDENEIKTITLPEKMTIKELADKMKQQPSAIIKKLFLKGQMVTMNSDISFEEAEEIALEFNYICEAEEKVDVIAELLKEDEEDEATMVSRPPVVCVMGHVDHGKTSLLDAIRSTKVTDREAGGITQHIGASVVSINGQSITFLDTPGHEAFTAMRMRGANSTDIAILVVAADDGVMPQTVEAINHAKAAGVEIIVAVNKMDKPSANIDKVKQELSEYELIPEDWGGSTIFCPVSAHTKEGIDNLLEMILLTAEVLELKANPNRNARGLVIEAQLDKGRGAVATMLV